MKTFIFPLVSEQMEKERRFITGFHLSMIIYHASPSVHQLSHSLVQADICPSVLSSIWPSLTPSLLSFFLKDKLPCVSVRLFLYLFVYLSSCLGLSICLSVYLSVCLSVFMPVCLSIHLKVCVNVFACSLFSVTFIWNPCHTMITSKGGSKSLKMS